MLSKQPSANSSAHIRPARTLESLACFIAGTLLALTLPALAQTKAAGDPPVILDQPIARTVSDGGHVTLSVRAQAALPMTFQWWKDGQLLADDSHLSGATNAVLNIDPVSTNDAGSYFVIIQAGSAFSTSAVAVVTINPVALQLTVGPGAGLTLRISGPVGDVYRIEGSANSNGPWTTNSYLTNRTGTVETFRPFAQLPNFMRARFDHFLPVLYPPHPDKLDGSTRIYGKLNQVWRIQKTASFVQWTEHAVVTNTTGWVRIVDAESDRQFYSVTPP